jgi:hypothetical protein
MRRRPAARGEEGLVALQAVLVYVIALAGFVWLLQFAVFTYGRGVVRAALDEGARAGSRVADSVVRCQDRAAETMSGLLGGTMGSGVTLDCRQDGDLVLAHADVHFVAWAPAMPDWTFSITATSRRTPAP